MRHAAAFVDLRFGFIDFFKQFEASLHIFELVYVREYGYAFTVLGNNERSLSLIYVLYVRANTGPEV
jgi:lipoprotein signal peptidase